MFPGNLVPGGCVINILLQRLVGHYDLISRYEQVSYSVYLLVLPSSSLPFLAQFCALSHCPTQAILWALLFSGFRLGSVNGNLSVREGGSGMSPSPLPTSEPQFRQGSDVTAATNEVPSHLQLSLASLTALLSPLIPSGLEMLLASSFAST